MVGGSVRSCSASDTLIRLAAPAAALVCPICDLTLPTAANCRSSVAASNTSRSAVSSVRSPTEVPVPWHSTRPTCSGPNPASSYARRSATTWPSRRGA